MVAGVILAIASITSLLIKGIKAAANKCPPNCCLTFRLNTSAKRKQESSFEVV